MVSKVNSINPNEKPQGPNEKPQGPNEEPEEEDSSRRQRAAHGQKAVGPGRSEVSLQILQIHQAYDRWGSEVRHAARQEPREERNDRRRQ